MMITLDHMEKLVDEIGTIKKKSIFHSSCDPVAYRLSKLNSQHRGAVVERYVRDYYIGKKKTVIHYGGAHSFDMLVDGKKVEVKSALAVAGKNGYTYSFKHICPYNFHKLVLCFISPEGLQFRVLDKKTVAKYLNTTYTHKNLRISKKLLGKLLAA